MKNKNSTQVHLVEENQCAGCFRKGKPLAIEGEVYTCRYKVLLATGEEREDYHHACRKCAEECFKRGKDITPALKDAKGNLLITKAQEDEEVD